MQFCFVVHFGAFENKETIKFEWGNWCSNYVVDRAKSMLQEWLVACLMRRTSISRSKQVGNAKWTKSSTGIFKCNIEGSFFKQTNRVGIRVCIIDATITFVLKKTEWFSPICEVHVGEALWLLSALD